MTIEPLETRIAPASVLTFIDVDGDSVKVISSLGDLKAAGVATLESGGIGSGFRLALLDLRDASFQGTTITTVVTKVADGDGLVHVGRIDATGRDLASVTIKGDLGKIDCGDANTATTALKTLSVRSMGVFGLATQGSSATDLVSTIKGPLGALAITGDLKDAAISVIGNANVDGRIGSVTIGGSLFGGSAEFSGSIGVFGTIGSVKIGRDLVGGAGLESGRIVAGERINSVTIGGSLFGGKETRSGTIHAFGGLGTVQIGGDVSGGSGSYSGRIESGNDFTSLSIAGSLLGGTGSLSGSIHVSFPIGSIKIGESVRGAAGATSGSITTGGKIASLSIGGSLLGGAGGEAVTNQGGSGSIFAYRGIDTLKIGHSVVGGVGVNSGRIYLQGKLASGSIGGSVVGAGGIHSGSLALDDGAGLLSIRGDLLGGSGTGSGAITDNDATMPIGTLTFGGSIMGGAGGGSGAVSTVGDVGTLKIGRDLRGGSISGSASLDGSGFIRAARIASLTIGGSVLAGLDDSTGTLLNSGSIRTDHDLGAISIRGNVLGTEGTGGIVQAIISARGQKTVAGNATSDVAIKSLAIGGSVQIAQVLAGFDPDDLATTGSNGNASIGTVTVNGDWYASSISAGINSRSLGFGSAGEVINNATDAIVARIASITIKGVVIGAPNPFFQVGFTAQQIGVFKAGAFTAKLTSGTDSIFLTPYTGNVNLLEI